MVDLVKLKVAKLLDTSAPLFERAPQLFHALAVVLNSRAVAVSKTFGNFDASPRHVSVPCKSDARVLRHRTGDQLHASGSRSVSSRIRSDRGQCPNFDRAFSGSALPSCDRRQHCVPVSATQA